MGAVDEVYAGMLSDCLAHGERVAARNGTRIRLVCPPRLEFTSTPLVSARRVAWKTALREWAWFMSGSNRLEDAHPSARPWWAPYANEAGAVPGCYGKQFRHWGGPFDQIENLVKGLKEAPASSRHVVTTWHADQMAAAWNPLPCCHGTAVQAFVEGGGAYLTLYAYQRSADLVVGVPHNWLAYWSFLLWLAFRCGSEPGRLIYQLGDAHVYEAHEGLAARVITAASSRPAETPQLKYEPRAGRPGVPFLAEDFSLGGSYEPASEERAEFIP